MAIQQRQQKNRKPAGRIVPAKTPKNRSLLVAVSTTVALVAMVAIGANARNTLLHEAAANKAADRFEQQMQPTQRLNESPSERMAHAATAEVAAYYNPERLPPGAKPAKNRKEAKAVMRPLVSSNSSITYDPFGRMVGIIDPGPVTRQFVYSGDRLCEERNGSGAVTKQFFDWGEIINGTKYFYTRNHEGSVTEMTDSSGNVVAQYSYDPFGNVMRIAGSGPDSDFLYAGYFYHQPSGLYITAHRLYNPKLGRWLNRDPIDDPTFAMMPQSPDSSGPSSMMAMMPVNPVASVMAPMMQSARDPMLRTQLARLIPQVPGTRMPEPNPYEYVANNPINNRDPSGLDMSPPSGGGICPSVGDCYRKCNRVCAELYPDLGPGFTDCLNRCYALCRK